jgi:MoaA/NifB/PqqE/SkfB family radical SAM enzyme
MRPDRFHRAVEVWRSEGFVAMACKTARHGFGVLKTPFARVPRIWRGVADSVRQHGYEILKVTLLRSRLAESRNLLLAFEDLDAKSAVMRANPRDITIESTTFCNLKCVMCRHGVEGKVTDKRHFPEHLVRRLIPFLATASRFQLHGLGEPLMSPAFWKLLDRITKVHRGAPEISFNTNGTLLTEKNIARLLATKAREINISFDAATAETYEKIRGGDFSQLLDNVTALVRARSLAGRADFRIIVNMTLMRANIEELPQFIRLAKQLGVDEVGFWRMNEGENFGEPDWAVNKGDWKFSYDEEITKYFPNLYNAAVREALRIAKELNMPLLPNAARFIEGEGEHEDRDYSPVSTEIRVSGSSAASPAVVVEPRPVAAKVPEQLFEISPARNAGQRRIDGASGIPAPKSATIGKCQAPWEWLFVNNRGECRPCCYMQDPIGNLERQTVHEIWNGSTIQEIRSSIAKDEVHRLCQGASCSYVRGDGAQ